VATAIGKQGGQDAVAMRLAEQYIDAFRQLARNSNTLVLPASANDTAGMVAQALTVFDSIKKNTK